MIAASVMKELNRKLLTHLFESALVICNVPIVICCVFCSGVSETAPYGTPVLQIKVSIISMLISYPSICDDVVGNPNLRALRKKNVNKLIIAHLNVNSLRNKFELLKEQIQDNIDILMISETEIDASFPIGQFLLNGYRTPFRLDRNAHGGCILLYVRYSFETFTCGRKSY